MTWLITGGAGYIGAHVVRAMTEAGERTVVYDDLSTGIAERVPDGVPLVVGSTLDGERVARALRDHEVTGVIHLAAKKQVGESVERPLHYYRENVEGLRVAAGRGHGGPGRVVRVLLLGGGLRHAVRRAGRGPGDGGHAVRADEPVRRDEAGGRVAGPRDGPRDGSLHRLPPLLQRGGRGGPELADVGIFNIVPMIFERLTAHEPPRVFGDDYPTRTAPAYGTTSTSWTWRRPMSRRPGRWRRHRAANSPSTSAGGRGLDSRADRPRERRDGPLPAPVVAPRRPGDPARVVASADRIATELGWKAKHDVQDMITSAWEGWVRLHPEAGTAPAPSTSGWKNPVAPGSSQVTPEKPESATNPANSRRRRAQ